MTFYEVVNFIFIFWVGWFWLLFYVWTARR